MASGREAGIRIRPMDYLDLDPVRELRSAVRWAADPRAFDLLRGIRHSRWAVAETRGGGLAGMVGAVPLGGIGILCHLAVHERYRRVGLGAELTSWAVVYLRSRGADAVRLYSTPEAEKLYRAMGFRAATPRIVYRLEGASRGPACRPRSRDAGYRAGLLKTSDVPEVCGLDRWSYGADRSALIFATLRLHPGRGIVVREASGRVKGYLVLSTTPHATHIGPFMASTPGVARVLLARALEDQRTTPVEVTVPGPPESPAHALLGEFGFTARRDRLRMELGTPPGPLTPGLEQYGTTAYLAT